jgi:hypothetical protein
VKLAEPEIESLATSIVDPYFDLGSPAGVFWSWRRTDA